MWTTASRPPSIPSTKRLAGSETIRYTNHSPDTLRFVWMQVDQNLFRPGSVGSLLFASESRFGSAGFQGGFEIDGITATAAAVTKPGKSQAAPKSPGRMVPVKWRVDDTMMYVELASPLAPGGTVVLEVKYAFNVPEHGADRMGRDGSLYEIAQWYPRMAVYDDVHGWNTDQYLGQGEFYLEYGDIDYEVTLPAGYIVGGTGILQNPAEVLTPTERRRLAAAVTSDSTVPIVTADELSSGAARPRRDGTLTWRFRAHDVRDVAWAASPEYLWDASGWDGTLAQAYYRPSAVEIWKDAAKMSRFSILEYSTHWFRYPYPQITAVGGPGLGNGISNARDGGAERRRAGALQRHHPRNRAYVVSDDGRVRRATVCLDGRGIQHVHQYVLRGGLLEARRHANPAERVAALSPRSTRRPRLNRS